MGYLTNMTMDLIKVGSFHFTLFWPYFSHDWEEPISTLPNLSNCELEVFCLRKSWKAQSRMNLGIDPKLQTQPPPLFRATSALVKKGIFLSGNFMDKV